MLDEVRWFRGEARRKGLGGTNSIMIELVRVIDNRRDAMAKVSTILALVCGILSVCNVSCSAGDDVDVTSGNSWLSPCSAKPFSDEKMSCIWYTLGLVDAHRFRLIGAKLFCIPEGVTTEQAAAIAVKFMNDHPESRHLPYAALLYRALRLAYPCSVGATANPQ